MKKIRELMDKLTLKQANTISIIISLLVTILLLGIFAGRFFKVAGEVDILIIVPFLLAPVFLCCVLYMMVSVIMKVPYKEACIREKEAKEYVMANYNLSYEEYTELKYCLEEALMGAYEPEMISVIWAKVAYKFYAKLTENEDVDLIAKDSNGNIIHNEVIGNFQYLKSYFEPLN